MSWVRILRLLVDFFFLARPGAVDLKHLDLEAAGGFSFSSSISTISSWEESTNGGRSSGRITSGAHQRYIHQIFWHRSSLRYTTPFWLGNDSLVRAAAAPEVKIPATLLLWEHHLLGSDSSPPAILGLFLLDFLWDGHFGKDCILLLHWVRSVNSESAVTDSRYKTLNLRTASSFLCHSRQSLSSESNSSTLCFSCSSINSTTLASSLKSLRCNSRRLHRLLGRKSAT